MSYEYVRVAQVADGMFLFAIRSKSVLSPTQPPIQLVSGDVFLGVKWSVFEADHLHLSLRLGMYESISPLRCVSF
jgi:hypothetical protein